MKPRVDDPEVGPDEAAVDEARMMDSPTRAADSLEIPQVTTSWSLPADTISTGVDTGAMPQAMMDQVAWDASVLSISTGMDVDVMSIAAVAVTTEQSTWSSSTGVDTDMQTSTRALVDDGAIPSGTESGETQPLSEEDSSEIVRSGSREEAPLGAPVSDEMIPQEVVEVAAESREHSSYMGTGYPIPTGHECPASNWFST